MSQEYNIRLDRWLWACRFFKTRALAKAAIEGGKVHVNGNKSKPGKTVQIGDLLRIRRGLDEKTVQVISLSAKRGPAKIAQIHYQETPESINKRETAAQIRKLAIPSSKTRPDKKQRRMIHRFKNKHDYDNQS